MNIEKMREQFEERKPVPAGIQWNADEARYVHSHIKMCTACKFHGYVELWAIWQASREAVVVDLSDCVADLFDGGSYYNQCKVDEAIEAQGLKVAP